MKKQRISAGICGEGLMDAGEEVAGLGQVMAGQRSKNENVRPAQWDKNPFFANS